VVVGGLFLAVLFAYLLLTAGKTWHLQGADLEEAPLRALTLTSLMALMVGSNAGFPWRLASTGALFALCLAILAASDARLGICEPFFAAPLRWRPGYSKTTLGGLMACTVLAAYITQQAALAENKIVSAIKLTFYAAKVATTDPQLSAKLKTELLQDIHEGITANPHYRKLTPLVADNLAASGDWTNAVWIWESVVASRPNVAAIWSNLAKVHAQLGQDQLAMNSLQHALQLEPDAPGLQALEVTLLGRTGHEEKALQLLNIAYDQGRYDYALLKAGYELGLKVQNWPLAIRALELRNKTWPEQAADAFIRLGNIYDNPAVGDKDKALAAFRAGLQAVPKEQKDNFRQQVPPSYWDKL